MILTNEIWNLVTVSSQTKPRFSLTFRDGFIILLGLVARMGVTGGTRMSPLVKREYPSEQVLSLCPLQELRSLLVSVVHVAPADLAVQ